MKGLNIPQLRACVIRPALLHLGLYSLAAEELLVGTAVQESRLHYLRQLNDGPAMGIFQMEPATHNDIWQNYLNYRPELAIKVAALSTEKLRRDAQDMAGNLFYACAMARVHYMRVPAPLPRADDVEGMAHYWKDHYNTHQGKGTVAEFVKHYHEAVA